MKKAAADLHSMLADDWVYLRGYRNNRGEIDGLLLGPGGLFAVECKHTAVTVHGRGDDWWSQRCDRWGNPRERGWLADATGRSPGTQLNDAAGALEHFLWSPRLRPGPTPSAPAVKRYSRS